MILGQVLYNLVWKPHPRNRDIGRQHNGYDQSLSQLPHIRCSWGDRRASSVRTDRAEVQAIGAGAVNQAIKALVLATGYLRNDGIDVVCVPEFVDVEIEEKVRTAIKLVVDPR